MDQQQYQNLPKKRQTYREDSNQENSSNQHEEQKRQQAGFFNKNKESDQNIQNSQQSQKLSQHDLFNKALEQLNQVQPTEMQICKQLNKLFTNVRKNEYSITQLYKAISYSKIKENIKISQSASASLIFTEYEQLIKQQINQKNTYFIQDLLKIGNLFIVENFIDIEKFMNPIIQQLINLLSLKQQKQEGQLAEQQQSGNELMKQQNFFFVRILLMCIINLLKNVGSSFQKQINEIFWISYNLFQQCTQLQEFQKQMINYNFLRMLVCLLRTLNFCLQEIKSSKEITTNNEQHLKAVENLLIRSYKLLFFGSNSTYHINIFGKKHTALDQYMQENESLIQQQNEQWRKKQQINSSTQYNSQLSQSSASELSETDEHFVVDIKKYEEQEEKIRNFACLLLHSTIRLYPKILENQWQLMIKSNNFTKEYVKFILKQEQLSFLQNQQKWKLFYQSAPNSISKESSLDQKNQFFSTVTQTQTNMTPNKQLKKQDNEIQQQNEKNTDKQQQQQQDQQQINQVIIGDENQKKEKGKKKKSQKQKNNNTENENKKIEKLEDKQSEVNQEKQQSQSPPNNNNQQQQQNLTLQVEQNQIQEQQKQQLKTPEKQSMQKLDNKDSSEELILQELQLSRDKLQEMLYPNYMDPSLLGCLVYEQNNKIKINVINCLIILLESLPIKQWLIGLDVEKLEKTNTSACQSTKAYLLFQAIKNIHLTLMYCLHKEMDIVVVNQILHLYSIIISSTLMFDKIQPDIGVTPLCKNFLILVLRLQSQSLGSTDNQGSQQEKQPKIMAKTNSEKDSINNKMQQQQQYSDIGQQNLLSLKFNTMSCVNNLLSLNQSWQSLEDSYLKLQFNNNNNEQKIQTDQQEEEFNYSIIEQNNPNNLFVIVFQTLRQFEQEKEFFDLRPEEGIEAVKNILLMEFLGFLIKVQKNYNSSFLQYQITNQVNSDGIQGKYILWDQLMYLFFKLKKKFNPDDKKLALLYKIIEEITRCQNQQQQNQEQQDDDDPPMINNYDNSVFNEQSQNITNSNTNSDNQQIKEFHNLLYFQFLPQFIMECLQHSNSEIITIGLNIICYIPNNIWQNKLYESKKKNLIQILMQLGERAITQNITLNQQQLMQQQKNALPSTVKYAYFRTLGVLSVSSSFNSDPDIAHIIIQKIIQNTRILNCSASKGEDSTKGSNNNILIKLSWALANWLCNIQIPIQISQLVDLLLALLYFSGLTKEKIASSGLRGLGQFINKTDPKTLLKAVQEQQKSNFSQQNQSQNQLQQQKNKVNEQVYNKNINNNYNSNDKEDLWNNSVQNICKIFEKDLKHQSSKVCWNACVALRNILKSQNEDIIQNLLKYGPIFEGLLQILRDRSNFKTQIHCINVLMLLQKKDFLGDFYYQFLQTARQLLQELSSHPYSFAEFKYLQTLREQSILLFMNLLIFLDNTVKQDKEAFRDIAKNSMTLIHEETSNLIMTLWKKTKKEEDLQLMQSEKEKIIEQGQLKDEKMKNKVFNLNKVEENKDKKKNIEEIEEEKVKGEENIRKIRFEWNILEQREGQQSIQQCKEKLLIIKNFSHTICKMIDCCEDFEISFGMYECFKQISELQIESTFLEVTLYNYYETEDK